MGTGAIRPGQSTDLRYPPGPSSRAFVVRLTWWSWRNPPGTRPLLATPIKEFGSWGATSEGRGACLGDEAPLASSFYGARAAPRCPWKTTKKAGFRPLNFEGVGSSPPNTSRLGSWPRAASSPSLPVDGYRS